MTDSEDEQAASEFAARADEPSEVDELGFEAYIQAIQEFVTNDSTQPPLTISIEGEWGSGKSSFMRQLRRSLDQQGQKTVEFNPWKHEKRESLWAAFALKFAQDMQNEFGWLDRIQKRGELLFRRYITNSSLWSNLKLGGTVLALLIPLILLLVLWFEFGAKVIAEAAGLSSNGSTHWALLLLLQFGGALTAVVSYMRVWSRLRTNFTGSIQSNLLRQASNPGYQDKVGFLDSFHDDLEQIMDVYLEKDERVFVFIDDLDRCSVPKTTDLMQAINLLVSDNSHLVFILGLDRKRVAAGMAAKHEDLLNVLDKDIDEGPDRLSFGYQYLEKFIQIPFLVPEPKEGDIRRLISGEGPGENSEGDIQESWKSIMQEYDEKLDDVVDMAVPALGSNPRRVKRFMNLYQLRAVLAQIEGVLVQNGTSPSTDKITLEQLAKLVIISIQWPQLISKIYNDPTAVEALVKSTREKEEVDLAGLEPWSSDTQLLNLLTYGEGQDYDIQNVNIESLMKISPRVDIPTESESGHGSLNRKVQVCQFISSKSDVTTDRWDFDQVKPSELDIDILNYDTLSQEGRANQSRALQSYIWIVEPSFWNNDEFERLYQAAPSQTEIIFLGGSLPNEISSNYPDAILAESGSEVESIVKTRLKLVSNPDDDSVWQEWRNMATKARDDYLHGA